MHAVGAAGLSGLPTLKRRQKSCFLGTNKFFGQNPFQRFESPTEILLGPALQKTSLSALKNDYKKSGFYRPNAVARSGAWLNPGGQGLEPIWKPASDCKARFLK
jgi:hypothetical protein